MPLTLVTPPTGEPISLAEAKLQVQQGQAYDDSFLGQVLIPAARDRCEQETGRALYTQTWDYVLDRFPSGDCVDIPKPPLVSVTYVKYYDTGGTLTTLTANTDYKVQTVSGPRAQRGRVYLPQSGTWPSTLEEPAVVIVRFVCGYGTTPDAIPPMLRQAMLMDIGSMYLHREDVITGTIVAPMPRWSRAVYWNYKSHTTTRAA